MDAVLPGFVGQLLTQGRDPANIPDLTVAATTGWLPRLASRLLPLLNDQPRRSQGAFSAHGYGYLPLQTADAFKVYLRVSDTRAMTLWRVHAPAVALTVTGVTMLELYRSPDEAKSGRPQYARMFRDGEFFTAHPGTLCATRGTAATVQVLATTEPITSSDRPLPIPAYAHGVQRARRALEHASLALIGEVC